MTDDEINDVLPPLHDVKPPRISDPVEREIFDLLTILDVPFVYSGPAPLLDFYLPDFDVHIECKRFHTTRTAKQMARTPRCIVVQSVEAAQCLTTLFAKVMK